VTNAQRKALSRMAAMNASSNDSKPLPTHSSAFCPHEAGAYYIATVGANHSKSQGQVYSRTILFDYR
jgi:hypothetical protein